MGQGHIRLDKKEDKGPQVEELKAKFASLQAQARGFMVGHKYMKPKERAQRLNELSKGFQELHRELEKFKSHVITNTGVKFALEAFRNSYNSFLPKWKKFEAELLGL